ncbi:MAG: phosphatase PAP2 family protein [Lachnospiraceae bacterium]|nr:phosphatase PAP2 family protein [Lachnospiraceae bacterium]
MEFSILYWIQRLRHPILDELMQAVTFLGDAGWIWILLGVVLFCGKRTRRCGAAVLLSLLIGFFVGNLMLKNLVGRSRPSWIDQSIALLIANPDDFSFPSGHTLAGFEAAVSVLLYDRRKGTAVLILAVVIGLSRLYLFVHFPSDVLAGALLGTGIAYAAHWCVEKITALVGETYGGTMD